jgi:hypothetical protein
MAQHTPGPWRASSAKTLTDRGWYVDHVSDPTLGKLDLICDNARPEDARLIAAAPDLLAALQHVLQVLNHPIVRDAIEQARAAIAKATGDDEHHAKAEGRS